MDVSIKQIHELIRQGVGISTEFKICRNKINRNIFIDINRMERILDLK